MALVTLCELSALAVNLRPSNKSKKSQFFS